MSHVEILTIVAAYAGAVVIGITMAVLVTSSIGEWKLNRILKEHSKGAKRKARPLWFCK
jgi:hypothetical protein